MLVGLRSGPVLLAGIAVVLSIILILLLGYGMRAQRLSASESEGRILLYDAIVNRAVQRCAAQPLSQQYVCIDDVRSAAAVNERDEHDLIAQETTAVWATVMAALALIGSFISIAGIYLVRRSLEHTATAVEIANETLSISKAEQRSWVTLEREVECDFTNRGDFMGDIHWNYNLKNKGKSPAYGINTFFKIIKRGHLQHLRSELEGFVEECRGHGTHSTVQILFPDELTDFLRHEMSASNAYDLSENAEGRLEKKVVAGKYFLFMACITYRTGLAINSTLGVEARVMRIDDEQGMLGPWRHKLLEFSAYRIVE